MGEAHEIAVRSGGVDHDELEHLREQVEALMKDRVTPAIADFAGRAGSLQDARRG